MHPLSLFPQLFTFEIFAPLLLRITVSIFILYLGLNRYKKEYQWVSILYFASALFVFLGLYAQLASLVSVIVLKADFYLDFYKNRKITPILKEKYFLYVMAIVILLSLLVTGPGAFAFDLPL